MIDWLRIHPIGLECAVCWVPEYHEFRMEPAANDDGPDEPMAA